MQLPPHRSSSKPAKNRIGLKLAALFLGTFLTVFVGLLFLDLLYTMGEGALVDAATSSQPAVTAIDPKLETDLAKVLEYKDAQTTADIRNPFADQSGISAAFNAPTALSQPPANSAAKTINPATPSNSPQPQRNQPATPSQTQNVAANTVPPDPRAETRARLQLREERIRLGMDAGPEAVAYAIDDLLPVGEVSGGDGKTEVMFYSASACRVVSFPVGTQFYDGWFESLRPEGVVFGFYDRARTTAMRSWARSVAQGCTQGSTETNSQNQTQVTRGGD